MQYNVMLSKQPDSSWLAVVPALPDCVAEAATREDALARIKERIARTHEHFEFVQVEVPGGPLLNGHLPGEPEKPFEEVWPEFGAHKGDSNWGAFFEELDRQRQ